MSRIVKFVAAYGEFNNGDIVEIDDQLAVSVLAQGYAVPCVDPKPEPAAFVAAPENIAEEAAPEAPAIDASPETVAAGTAPETA